MVLVLFGKNEAMLGILAFFSAVTITAAIGEVLEFSKVFGVARHGKRKCRVFQAFPA